MDGREGRGECEGGGGGGDRPAGRAGDTPALLPPHHAPSSSLGGGRHVSSQPPHLPLHHADRRGGGGKRRDGEGEEKEEEDQAVVDPGHLEQAVDGVRCAAARPRQLAFSKYQLCSNPPTPTHTHAVYVRSSYRVQFWFAQCL